MPLYTKPPAKGVLICIAACGRHYRTDRLWRPMGGFWLKMTAPSSHDIVLYGLVTEGSCIPSVASVSFKSPLASTHAHIPLNPQVCCVLSVRIAQESRITVYLGWFLYLNLLKWSAQILISQMSTSTLYIATVHYTLPLSSVTIAMWYALSRQWSGYSRLVFTLMIRSM